MVHRSAATSRHLRRAGGAESVSHPELAGNRGGSGGDAPDYKRNTQEDVSDCNHRRRSVLGKMPVMAPQTPVLS